MFEIFGEFDSVEELNRAAEGLLNEGDTESLLQLAEENGLDPEDADDYIHGGSGQLASLFMAACGRIAVDEKENINQVKHPMEQMAMQTIVTVLKGMLTDSGGLQEEAPSCGVPVLVLRTETERPEAVEAGTVKVVGVEEEAVYENAKLLLTDKREYEKMAKAVNPYGDGHASARIVNAIWEWKNNGR